MSVSKEDEAILKKIGFQIGKRREELDKTQDEIAQKLGIDRGNYTKMENGNRERRFSVSQLVTISETLNTSLDYIFGKTNEATPDIKLKNFCDEYGLKESTLKTIKNIKESNTNSIECVNEFINGYHISPYFFEEIKKITIYKKLVKNIILFSNLFDFEDVIINYYEEKNSKELNKIFDYFSTFTDEINTYSKQCPKDSHFYGFSHSWQLNLLKAYTCGEIDLKVLYDKQNKYNSIDIKNLSKQEQHREMGELILFHTFKSFQRTDYGVTSTLSNINIKNYIAYMKSECVAQIEKLHKEFAYCKYNISTMLDSYLNAIEDYTYLEDIKKISSEDSFIKSLINKQNKMKGAGKRNGNNGNRKK